MRDGGMGHFEMKQLKAILDFFLFSNVFISLCAASMAAETFFLLPSAINWLYVAFVFSSTLMLYTFPVFTESNFHPEYSLRHRWISENRKIILLISISGLVPTGILVFFFPIKFILWFIPIVIIALAYFFPQTRLRSITGVKTFIVAFVWTCVTALFPLLLISNFDLSSFRYDNAAILLQNFLFIFPLCVIYNVRDIEADQKAGVKTFPVVYGVRVTIAVCLISLVLFSALIILSPPFKELKTGLLLSAVISAALLLFASEKRTDYYYSLWIDGMVLLQTGFVILSACF
jgi:UbiA prenyltransferase family